MDDRRNDEARRPGEAWRQAEIFGADISDCRVDEIAEEPDRGEGGNLLGDAPIARGLPARWRSWGDLCELVFSCKALAQNRNLKRERLNSARSISLR